MIIISNSTIISGGRTIVGPVPILDVPFELNLYGRFNKNNPPVVEHKYIDYSFDGESWATSELLTKDTSNDPIYNLIFSTTSTQTDVWVRPGIDGTTVVMLGDTISLTGESEGEYPYSYPEPYQYSVLNASNIPSSGTTNLYFEIAQF